MTRAEAWVHFISALVTRGGVHGDVSNAADDLLAEFDKRFKNCRDDIETVYATVWQGEDES